MIADFFGGRAGACERKVADARTGAPVTDAAVGASRPMSSVGGTSVGLEAG